MQSRVYLSYLMSFSFRQSKKAPHGLRTVSFIFSVYFVVLFLGLLTHVCFWYVTL